jgi:hypothetical protein
MPRCSAPHDFFCHAALPTFIRDLDGIRCFTAPTAAYALFLVLIAAMAGVMAEMAYLVIQSAWLAWDLQMPRAGQEQNRQSG